MRRVAFGLLLVGLVGCGSSSHRAAAPSSSPTVTTASTATATADLGARYMATVAPANAALQKFQSAADRIGENGTAKQYAEITGPLVAAYKAVDEALLRVDWPANIKPDINALVTADSGFAATLGDVGSQTGLTVGAWRQQLSVDIGKMTAAVSIVRADLGLPPAK